MNEVSKDKKRFYEEINIARGILVIFVVVGHIVLQTNTSSKYLSNIYNIIGQVIYSFHMPMFFALAGFVAVNSLAMTSKNEKINYIKLRTKRLLVPYLFMGCIYLPFRIILAKYARTEYVVSDFWRIIIGKNPDGALWFLYVLYVISIIVCVFVTNKKIYIVTCLGLIACIVSYLYIFPISIINTIMTSFFFYVGGICVRLNYEKIRNIFKIPIVAVINGLVFIMFNVIFIRFSSVECIKLITSISGIILFWYISLQLSYKRNKIYEALFTLGNYSMDIYILSEPIKVIARTLLRSTNVVVMSIICIFISILLPVLISKYFIRKNKILRGLFFGM